MVSIEVDSPDIFDQLASQSIGLRTAYPVISEQVAREVLGPVDDNFVLQDGATTQARLTYLDGAATTKFLPTTYATFVAYAQHVANTHSPSHLPARITDHNYHLAHEILLRFAHANPETHTAIFTGQGTTDAILHIARTLFDRHAVPDTRDTVIFSGSEHHANILPWLYYAPRALGVPVEEKERGTLPIEGIRKALAENKGRVKVVAITGTSNVTGILSNIREVAKMVHDAGALLLVDAAHLFGHAMGVDLPGMGLVGMKEMGIDILVGSGHKVYAPGAPGFLIMPKSLSRPIPARVGGGIVQDVDLKRAVFMDALPDREEAGTPPIVGAIMLASSLTLLEAIGMQRVWDHELALTRTTIAGLSDIKGVKVYGDNDLDRTPRAGVVSFSVEGLHHAVVSRALSDYFNIATRNGCFCAQPYLKSILELEDDEIEASVAAVTSGDRSKAPGLVRAGFGVYTVKKDVERLLAAVKWVSQNRERLNAEYAVHKNGSATRNDGWTVDPASYAILPTVEGGRILLPAVEGGKGEGGNSNGSPMLMGGIPLGGGALPLVAGVGLDGIDLSWVPTAGAGIGALAAGLATLLVGTRYVNYRKVKGEMDTALAEWPLIHQEFVSSLRRLGKSFSFLDFPDKEAKTWRLKPAIAEQRLRMSLALVEEVERRVNQLEISFQSADSEHKIRLLRAFVTHMERLEQRVRCALNLLWTTPFDIVSMRIFLDSLNGFLKHARRGLEGRPAVELLAGRLTSQIGRSLDGWEEKLIEDAVENYASPTWVESVHQATLNVFSDAGQAISAELDHIVRERSQRLNQALKILSRVIRQNPHRNFDFPSLVKKLRQGNFEVEAGEGNRIEELSLALQSYATVLSNEFDHSAELVERVWERLAVVSQRGAVSTYEIDVMERNLAFWVVPGRPLTGRTPIVHLFVEQIAFKPNDSRRYLEQFRDQPAVVVFDPKKATATKEGMEELESHVRLMIAEKMGIHPNKVQLKTHVFSGEVKPLQPPRVVRLVGGSSPIRLVAGEDDEGEREGEVERRKVGEKKSERHPAAGQSIWGAASVFSLGRRGLVPVR